MDDTYAEVMRGALRHARLTFPAAGTADLTSAVDGLAARLSRVCGADRGRVAVVNEPGAIRQSVTAYLAALRAGFTPGLLRPAHTTGLPDYLSGHSFVAAIRTATGDIDELPEAGRDRQAGREDLIVFTSGTTARPKGVRYSLDRVVHNLDATQSYLHLSDTDHLALPLPIHYVYGLSSLNLALRHCAAVTFLDYTQPPITWLGSLIAAQPTIVALLPHQARLLLRASEFNSAHLPYLRAITVAGGALGPDAALQLMDRFEAAEIFLMYGQTEAGPRASFVPQCSLPESAHTIGAGIPGYTQLRVSDTTVGAVSQLQVASSSLMLGYLDDDDTSPIGADGWLSTGDMAYVDDNGHFVLVGRCAPFFKPFDQRVSFREILDAAREIVPDAAFGLDTEADPIRGERLVLTASLPPADSHPYSEEQIRRALQRRLGTGRAPAKVLLKHRREGHKLD